MSPPQLKILRAYAKMDDASIAAKLPPTVYFSHTRHTLTIFDAFPKALFHFLVLPRLLRPVAASASTTSATAASASPTADHEEEEVGGGGGARDEQLTSPPVNNSEADLTSLRTLLGRAAAAARAPDTSTSTSGHGRTRARAEAEATLRVLADEAERLRREIEREMHARYGFAWSIWTGFHAVPSMEHLHLHVISSDLTAPALKTKRHYHSFSPSSGFFLPLAEVCAWFDEDGLLARKARLAPEEYEPRLKDALVCFRCSETAKNMPALKKHLQAEFDTLRKRELGKLKRKRETETVSGSLDGIRPIEKTARVSGAQAQAQAEKGDTGNP